MFERVVVGAEALLQQLAEHVITTKFYFCNE